MHTLKLPLVILAAGVLAACTELTTLEQQNPGQLDASGLYEPRNAQLLVNGVIADFECAFSRYAFGTAVFTDELTNAFAGSSNFDYDRRTLPTNAPYGTGACNTVQTASIYTPLSVARSAADTAAARLESWTDAEVPNRNKLIGESY